MKRALLITALAAIAAAMVPGAATPLPAAGCTPVAETPDVSITNYAVFRGYTVGCGNPPTFTGYHYSTKIFDADTGSTLAFHQGSTDGGNENFGFDTYAYCLRPNGTARNVKGTLTIWITNYSRSSTSGSVQCERIGGVGE